MSECTYSLHSDDGATFLLIFEDEVLCSGVLLSGDRCVGTIETAPVTEDHKRVDVTFHSDPLWISEKLQQPIVGFVAGLNKDLAGMVESKFGCAVSDEEKRFIRSHTQALQQGIAAYQQLQREAQGNTIQDITIIRQKGPEHDKE